MVSVVSMGAIFDVLLYGVLISATVYFSIFGVLYVLDLLDSSDVSEGGTVYKLTVWYRALKFLGSVASVFTQAFAYTLIVMCLISTAVTLGWL